MRRGDSWGHRHCEDVARGGLLDMLDAGLPDFLDGREEGVDLRAVVEVREDASQEACITRRHAGRIYRSELRQTRVHQSDPAVVPRWRRGKELTTCGCAHSPKQMTLPPGCIHSSRGSRLSIGITETLVARRASATRLSMKAMAGQRPGRRHRSSEHTWGLPLLSLPRARWYPCCKPPLPCRSVRCGS